MTIPSTTDKEYLTWLMQRGPKEGSKKSEPYRRGASAATLYWMERMNAAKNVKKV